MMLHFVDTSVDHAVARRVRSPELVVVKEITHQLA